MPNHPHNQSAELAARAAGLVKAGHISEARGLYRDAAGLEQRAFAEIAADKTRTRGILAVSHVALLFKAHALDLAESWAYRYLADESVPPPSAVALKELLEVVWDEQVLARQGQEYSGHEVQFALRGGVIGVGTAPVGIATHTLSAADSFLYRAMEFRGGRPLRRQGQPPEDYLERLQARATQPAVGSYRFSVRLVEPPQRVLFPESEDSVTPESIAAFVVDFVNAVNAGSDDGLTALVPDLSYRSALLKLVRNLVPSPDAASELEITHLANGRSTATALMLTDPARQAVARAIRAAVPISPPDAVEQSVQMVGTLRALDLDKDRLEILVDDHHREVCITPADFLDDIVGPLVNRRVVVNGHWKTVRGRRQFAVTDIERV